MFRWCSEHLTGLIQIHVSQSQLSEHAGKNDEGRSERSKDGLLGLGELLSFSVCVVAMAEVGGGGGEAGKMDVVLSLRTGLEGVDGSSSPMSCMNGEGSEVKYLKDGRKGTGHSSPGLRKRDSESTNL